MKRLLLSAALLAPLPALILPAQAQSPAPLPTKLFSSAADVRALIAKAKAEHKGDTVNTIEHIVTLPGYPVQLEYRTGMTPPTVHPTEAELIEVIDGSCTLVTGGTLAGIKPGNPGAKTLAGTAIEGGRPQKIAKGDYVLVPANTPHWYTDVHGLVIMSLHMPADAK